MVLFFLQLIHVPLSVWNLWPTELFIAARLVRVTRILVRIKFLILLGDCNIYSTIDVFRRISNVIEL